MVMVSWIILSISNKAPATLFSEHNRETEVMLVLPLSWLLALSPFINSTNILWLLFKVWIYEWIPSMCMTAMFMTLLNNKYWYTGLGNNTCTWLRECFRKAESEVVSNSRKLYKTTYKYLFPTQYVHNIILDKHISTSTFELFFIHSSGFR